MIPSTNSGNLANILISVFLTNVKKRMVQNRVTLFRVQAPLGRTSGDSLSPIFLLGWDTADGGHRGRHVREAVMVGHGLQTWD
ncbi:MAG: hypothetical protein ACC628_11380 [Pirellulaceae bacterium]